MKLLENKYFRRIFITLLIAIAGWIARLLISPDMSLAKHIIGTVVFILLIQIVWEIFERIHKLLNHLLPFSRYLYLRLGVQLLSGIIIMVGFVLLMLHMLRNYVPFPLNDVTRGMVIISDTILSIAINMTFISHYFIQRWKESVVRTERLEKDKIQMQYNQLKDQVDPHFLFNALTTLDSLVKSDPELASRFIGHMAKIYRYVLQHRGKEVVSLASELEFVHHYLSLQDIRFRQGLQVNIRLSESAREKGIVMVTLQMLIDNAIKHNEIHPQHPLQIDIYDQEDGLYVTNNKQKKKLIMHSNRQGLQQLKQLYTFLSEHPVEVYDEAARFTIKLPLL